MICPFCGKAMLTEQPHLHREGWAAGPTTAVAGLSYCFRRKGHEGPHQDYTTTPLVPVKKQCHALFTKPPSYPLATYTEVERLDRPGNRADLQAGAVGPVRITSGNCFAGDHDECLGMVEQDVAELGITDCMCHCHAPAPALPPSDPVTSFDRESDVDTLRNAIHQSGMILVDQVSGKPVDDAEETVLRYARLSEQSEP